MQRPVCACETMADASVRDLFLLSLKEMHEMSPNDQLSFFQIAGTEQFVSLQRAMTS